MVFGDSEEQLVQEFQLWTPSPGGDVDSDCSSAAPFSDAKSSARPSSSKMCGIWGLFGLVSKTQEGPQTQAGEQEERGAQEVEDLPDEVKPAEYTFSNHHAAVERWALSFCRWRWCCRIMKCFAFFDRGRLLEHPRPEGPATTTLRMRFCR